MTRYSDEKTLGVELLETLLHAPESEGKVEERAEIRLFNAIKRGDLAGVKAVIERSPEGGIDIDAFDENGSCALVCAAAYPNPDIKTFMKPNDRRFPDKKLMQRKEQFATKVGKTPNASAIAIFKYLVEKGAKVDWGILKTIAGNTGPNALPIVDYLLRETNVASFLHKRNIFGVSVFIAALEGKNIDVAEYLMSRDDFWLSDLMPWPDDFPLVEYEDFRERAISRVEEMMERKGIPYARSIAADIAEILKDEDKSSYPLGTLHAIKRRPTKEDVEVLQKLVRKISMKDWAAEAQVSSDDFISR